MVKIVKKANVYAVKRKKNGDKGGMVGKTRMN